MKKLFFIACVAFIGGGCKSPETKTETVVVDSTATPTTTAKLDYPYTLDRPYSDWQPGDQQHAVTVMKMLKAWETKNFTECASYFGDSCYMHFDYYHKKLPHDSLPGFLDMSWADIDKVTIKMEDWESVISADKKDEWVTLWYKQTWVDKKGKTDSISLVNDAKITNGKITVFDEKLQHYEKK